MLTDMNKNQKNRRHPVLAAVGILAALGAIAGGAYLVRGYMYVKNQQFIKGTYINDIDVSDLSLEEVESILKEKVEDYGLTVTLPDGSEQSLSAEDMGFTYTSTGELENLLANVQDSYRWAGYLFDVENRYQVSEQYTYDADTLRDSVLKFPAFQEENITDCVDAYVTCGEDGNYEIIPEVYGNRIDVDNAVEMIGAAIDNKEAKMTIDDSAYLIPAVTKDDEGLREIVEQLNQFLSFTVAINVRDGQVVIDREKLKSCIVEDEETHTYSIDDDMLHSIALEAAAEVAERENATYSTYEFQTTKSGTVSLNSPSYGCTVDQTAEADQIYEELLAETDTERSPIYSEALVYPVGDTYVEVDILNQEVFMYVDGELILDTPCVSGTDYDPELRSDRGLFYVTWVVGQHHMYGPRDANGVPSYDSVVNFGIYYNGGEALHDASWRYSFGGDTYLYSGSHGCINLPYDAAKTIYENAYEGMPVIVFGDYH